MNILLLEDDNLLNKSISKILTLKGYKVTSFYDGEEALENFGGYDLYILDINTPNINGLEILSHIVSVSNSIKVIMMSSDINIRTIQDAYESGCYDYLKKPFQVEELLFKVNIIAKTFKKNISLKNDISYDLYNKILYNNKTPIILTNKELLLLNLLVINIGKTVTFSQIEFEVYNDKPTNQASIRAIIKRLRDKIGKDTITTMIDVGYCID